MVQREGRILRRGNENKEINIYRYIAEGSFDAYSWQILETKQRFITQFLLGSSYQRSAYDLEENVLTYAEVKALALSEPLMKIKAEKENELKTLKLLRTKESEENKRLSDELSQLSSKVFELESLHSRVSSMASKLKHNENQYQTELELQELKTVLTKEFLYGSGGETEYRVSYFQIVLPENQDEKKPYIILQETDTYQFRRVCETLYMGENSSGNAIRISNFLKNYDKRVKDVQEQIEKAKRRKSDIEAVLSTTSTLSGQIKALEDELYVINSRITIDEPEDIVY